MKYEDRIKLTTNPTAQRLLQIMAEKETNLAVAADVTSADELVRLAQVVGDEICVLKTHIDIVTDFSADLVEALTALQKKHKFLIFEDRKFADIGNTVQMQYSQGIYHIVDWADIVNAHVVPGPGIIEGLREVGKAQGRGLLLLAEMSAKGNLATGKYTRAAVRMTQEYSDFVIGFIAMKKLVADPKFITMTPGVKMQKGGGALKQQYHTPVDVISGGSDVIIVGRGIYAAKDARTEAKKYRAAGWQAYQKLN